MAADRQVDLQRPVGLHPIEIEHVQPVRNRQPAGLADGLGELAQDRLAQRLVPAAAQDVQRRDMQALARQQPAAQAELQEAFLLQGLHQPVRAGLGDVQALGQRGRAERLLRRRHRLDDFQHAGDGGAFLAGNAAHRLPCRSMKMGAPQGARECSDRHRQCNGTARATSWSAWRTRCQHGYRWASGGSRSSSG